LETTLAAAEAAALQPWQERSSGARRALGDLGVDRQRYVAEHFDALVAEREAEGEAVAGRVTDAADVSRSRADELARAANALLFAGGEEPPVLSHDPRKPHHAEAVSA
jgi:hypothetical protein